ncbi:hypothetical protein AB0I81_15475 [Nonomuraea sp. NPDC050404]|uniref:glycoside hydrolase family 130 protein n=1 Tax=Nonomuraea sp. NPDC050404 TaxID=3155783 RepID=UPI0033E3B30F
MTFPYRLVRAGVLMAPDEDEPFEAEGVLNPACGRGPDGRLYLLPRLVARGNVSRIGLARVEVVDGVPAGVRREGVVLAPERGWERGAGNAGVEDPRVTYLPVLGLHVMTYVAFGPLGPRLALATSADLREWRRLGPVQFGYDDGLDVDLNLYPNKDAVFFPEPVSAPDGTSSLAMLHRPMWDLGTIRPGQGSPLPSGLHDDRPGIWISYVPLAEVVADASTLVRLRGHRLVALPEYPYEELKLGAGPAPIRVPEGWLMLHHGAAGTIGDNPFEQQQGAVYSAGAMILDADDPARVLSRSKEPLLSPETDDEVSGTVPNVVFPTTAADIDGTLYVFYGMADTKIGIARLERTP